VSRIYLSSIKGVMLFSISYDELSYIYTPHGTEPEVWSTTLEGSEMLKAAGWRPFEMHRVSRHLHLSLITGGHLEAFSLEYPVYEVARGAETP
jgi:hypothetical protein